jgi:hypothetical protein
MDPVKAQRIAEWYNRLNAMPPTARARHANFDPNALIGKAA